jgi:hypothetical protein
MELSSSEKYLYGAYYILKLLKCLRYPNVQVSYLKNMSFVDEDYNQKVFPLGTSIKIVGRQNFYKIISMNFNSKNFAQSTYEVELLQPIINRNEEVESLVQVNNVMKTSIGQLYTKGAQDFFNYYSPAIAFNIVQFIFFFRIESLLNFNQDLLVGDQFKALIKTFIIQNIQIILDVKKTPEEQLREIDMNILSYFNQTGPEYSKDILRRVDERIQQKGFQTNENTLVSNLKFDVNKCEAYINNYTFQQLPLLPAKFFFKYGIINNLPTKTNTKLVNLLEEFCMLDNLPHDPLLSSINTFTNIINNPVSDEYLRDVTGMSAEDIANLHKGQEFDFEQGSLLDPQKPSALTGRTLQEQEISKMSTLPSLQISMKAGTKRRKRRRSIKNIKNLNQEGGSIVKLLFFGLILLMEPLHNSCGFARAAGSSQEGKAKYICSSSSNNCKLCPTITPKVLEALPEANELTGIYDYIENVRFGRNANYVTGLKQQKLRLLFKYLLGLGLDDSLTEDEKKEFKDFGLDLKKLVHYYEANTGTKLLDKEMYALEFAIVNSMLHSLPSGGFLKLTPKELGDDIYPEYQQLINDYQKEDMCLQPFFVDDKGNKMLCPITANQLKILLKRQNIIEGNLPDNVKIKFNEISNEVKKLTVDQLKELFYEILKEATKEENTEATNEENTEATDLQIKINDFLFRLEENGGVNKVNIPNEFHEELYFAAFFDFLKPSGSTTFLLPSLTIANMELLNPNFRNLVTNFLDKYFLVVPEITSRYSSLENYEFDLNNNMQKKDYYKVFGLSETSSFQDVLNSLQNEETKIDTLGEGSTSTENIKKILKNAYSKIIDQKLSKGDMEVLGLTAADENSVESLQKALDSLTKSLDEDSLSNETKDKIEGVKGRIQTKINALNVERQKLPLKTIDTVFQENNNNNPFTLFNVKDDSIVVEDWSKKLNDAETKIMSEIRARLDQSIQIDNAQLENEVRQRLTSLQQKVIDVLKINSFQSKLENPQFKVKDILQISNNGISDSDAKAQIESLIQNYESKEGDSGELKGAKEKVKTSLENIKQKIKEVSTKLENDNNDDAINKLQITEQNINGILQNYNPESFLTTDQKVKASQIQEKIRDVLSKKILINFFDQNGFKYVSKDLNNLGTLVSNADNDNEVKEIVQAFHALSSGDKIDLLKNVFVQNLEKKEKIENQKIQDFIAKLEKAIDNKKIYDDDNLTVEKIDAVIFKFFHEAIKDSNFNKKIKLKPGEEDQIYNLMINWLDNTKLKQKETEKTNSFYDIFNVFLKGNSNAILSVLALCGVALLLYFKSKEEDEKDGKNKNENISTPTPRLLSLPESPFDKAVSIKRSEVKVESIPSPSSSLSAPESLFGLPKSPFEKAVSDKKSEVKVESNKSTSSTSLPVPESPFGLPKSPFEIAVKAKGEQKPPVVAVINNSDFIQRFVNSLTSIDNKTVIDNVLKQLDEKDKINMETLRKAFFKQRDTLLSNSTGPRFGLPNYNGSVDGVTAGFQLIYKIKDFSVANFAKPIFSCIEKKCSPEDYQAKLRAGLSYLKDINKVDDIKTYFEDPKLFLSSSFVYLKNYTNIGKEIDVSFTSVSDINTRNFLPEEVRKKYNIIVFKQNNEEIKLPSKIDKLDLIGKIVKRDNAYFVYYDYSNNKVYDSSYVYDFRPNGTNDDHMNVYACLYEKKGFLGGGKNKTNRSRRHRKAKRNNRTRKN